MTVTLQNAGGSDRSSEVAATAPIPASFHTQSRPKFQLDFLHGMRGLAALYVVFFHLTGNIPGRENLPEVVRHMTSWLKHGYYAVDVFIVLSGFLLMSPVVRSGGTLPGGRWEFVKRRARRIIPAYVVAYSAFLLFWLGVSLVLGRLGEPLNPWIAGQMKTMYTWQSLLAHAFLAHNLHVDWICNGSNIFWTVALEWQIYFVFALLLLPVWRWLGTFAAVAASFGVGLLPVFVFTSFFCPVSWLVGLFGLGMAGSAIVFSPKPAYAWLRHRMPWGWLAALFFAGLVALTFKLPPYYAGASPKQQCLLEAIAGVITVCIILRVMKNYGTADQGTAPARANCWLGRCLEWKPVMGLSLFSYSLYLTHDMVVATLNLTVYRFGFDPMVSLLIYYGLGIPIALIYAYFFYLLFERPGGLKTVSRRIFSRPEPSLAQDTVKA